MARARPNGRGGERLDSGARLGGADARFEQVEHLLLDVGVVVDEAPERLAREDEEAHVAGGDHGCRAAGGLPDQRDLAEEVTRPESVDLFARLRDQDVSVDDDEELAADLPFARENLSLVELEVLRDLRELDELAPGQVLDERPSAVALSSCEKSCMRGIYRPNAPLPTASRSFAAAPARWLRSAFHSFPSSATVEVSPAGMKTGS